MDRAGFSDRQGSLLPLTGAAPIIERLAVGARWASHPGERVLLSQLGIEASPAVHYAIAFAIIFVLLTLFALVLRRLTGRRSALSGPGGRARQPRLGIVDVYDLDRQRQLILLRRDNVEHLLLIGGPNDVVIETNIDRVAGARLPASVAEPAPERSEPTLDRIADGPAVQPTPP